MRTNRLAGAGLLALLGGVAWSLGVTAISRADDASATVDARDAVVDRALADLETGSRVLPPGGGLPGAGMRQGGLSPRLDTGAGAAAGPGASPASSPGDSVGGGIDQGGGGGGDSGGPPDVGGGPEPGGPEIGDTGSGHLLDVDLGSEPSVTIDTTQEPTLSVDIDTDLGLGSGDTALPPDTTPTDGISDSPILDVDLAAGGADAELDVTDDGVTAEADLTEVDTSGDTLNTEAEAGVEANLDGVSPDTSAQNDAADGLL